VNVRPVTPARWPDLVELFEQRGPRGGRRNTPAYGCWCMWWRNRALEHGEPKKRAMGRLVRAGREPGLLAYEGARPVGWVAVAPREELTVLLRSPQYRPHDDDTGVWAVSCFVVDRPAQGRGVAAALLDAAVEHAFARGASAVEGYPHAVKGDDFMGGLELFERAGFRTVRDAGKRAIVRLER
jgi:GNAT superfamily N-acetyltransferase